jgi:hypothetical protein
VVFYIFGHRQYGRAVTRAITGGDTIHGNRKKSKTYIF